MKGTKSVGISWLHRLVIVFRKLESPKRGPSTMVTNSEIGWNAPELCSIEYNSSSRFSDIAESIKSLIESYRLLAPIKTTLAFNKITFRFG